VARVKYDLYDRSYLGAMVANRHGDKARRTTGGGGVDTQLSLNDTGSCAAS